MDWNDLPKIECLRGNDAEMLQFAVDRARQQFAWKTGGLSTEQLRRRHPPSTTRRTCTTCGTEPQNAPEPPGRS
ncbi:hypothetical protein GCM10009804_57570 [Kribbella hippodromi]|uniref:Uncharacterized protein n=1 Tax=Kribbella hippodromi TaxID=434347 RepID=A0ABP4PWV4_9ACTN